MALWVVGPKNIKKTKSSWPSKNGFGHNSAGLNPILMSACMLKDTIINKMFRAPGPHRADFWRFYEGFTFFLKILVEFLNSFVSVVRSGHLFGNPVILLSASQFWYIWLRIKLAVWLPCTGKCPKPPNRYIWLRIWTNVRLGWLSGYWLRTGHQPDNANRATGP